MSPFDLGLTRPWVLLALPLALLPLLAPGVAALNHPGIHGLPPDPWSRLIETGLRLAGCLAIAAILVGLADPYRDDRQTIVTSQGAQVAIVLDRSRSMNDTFAGRSAEGSSEVGKARAASELLLDFVNRRPDNLYGLIEFSTSPIFALPLTTRLTAIRAGLEAAAEDGLALTSVGGALGMAANLFEEQAAQGSRVVLLVSDGAAAIPPDAAGTIRQWFRQRDLRLYWVYMRTAGHPALAMDGEPGGEASSPEQKLHDYFRGLGVPYRAYQADNPEAMRRAIADIDQLERETLRTPVSLPRQALAPFSYIAALAMVGLLLAARAATLRRWA